MTARDRSLGLLVVALWGINFLALHAGLEHFPPFFFAALRFAVMAIPVILFVPRPDVPVKWLLLYGLGFGAGQFGLLFLAFAKGMPTGLASLVLQSSAPFTVILGTLLLGERMSVRQIMGISVAIGGMALIAVDRIHGGGSAGLVPLGLTLLAGLSWAFGNLGSRLAKTSQPLRLTLWMSVVPPIPLYAMSLGIEGPGAGFHALATLGSHSGLIALGALAYTVLLATVLASGIWTSLMSRYQASTVAPLSLLVPIVGITAAWIVLGEEPSWWEILGGAVVIGGCAVGVIAKPRAKAASATPEEPSTQTTSERKLASTR